MLWKITAIRDTVILAGNLIDVKKNQSVILTERPKYPVSPSIDTFKAENMRFTRNDFTVAVKV